QRPVSDTRFERAYSCPLSGCLLALGLHSAFGINAQDAGAAELADRLAVVIDRHVEDDSLVAADQGFRCGPDGETHFLVSRGDLAGGIDQFDAARQASQGRPSAAGERLEVVELAHDGRRLAALD